LSTRGEQCSRADSLDLLRDASVESASAPPELDRPRRDLSIRRLKNDRDASGRLMQPTFSKTSTHALHSERRAATAEPCAATGPGVSTPPSPLTASLIRPARRVLSTQRGPNESWVLTPRHRVAESCAEAPILHPATKTVCPPHQFEETVGSRSKTPSAGREPCRALSRPRGERAGPASDASSPVARYRFGLARPVHFQPQPKASTPNRRRLPTSATVREHGHTGGTTAPRTEPAVSAHSVGSEFLFRTRERHGFRS
jgi:hypothetical protein